VRWGAREREEREESGGRWESSRADGAVGDFDEGLLESSVGDTPVPDAEGVLVADDFIEDPCQGNLIGGDLELLGAGQGICRADTLRQALSELRNQGLEARIAAEAPS